MFACFNAHLKTAQYLVSLGANIHDRDSKGDSCIIREAKEGVVSVVKFLLSVGANHHDRLSDGKTCFAVASDKLIKRTLYMWPVTMVVIVLQELQIYNMLYDCLFDLQRYM